ncbi:N-acetylmuramoyl-L-alanine amidase [Hamadaea tsunoensis]|uniref:N-acetylmuramoyl-L-alanine amidase n=1 Tax=Hamadaea tsunoensis TaxID=53368 RepID=UPI0003F952BF|nr:N-acetylmuramoyl-L-alanine amidase [Hamadaea tsunoensis]
MTVPPTRRATFMLGALILAAGVAAPPASAAAAPVAPDALTVASTPASTGSLTAAFDAAATRYGVPRDLLIAIGYAETHLDGHAGTPSAAGGYGVMNLTGNPAVHTLAEASRLTGLKASTLENNQAANILGAAAVLRSYAADLKTAQRDSVDNWYAAVARYGGATDPSVARLYADTVYDLLATGFGVPAKGVSVTARAVAPQRGTLATARASLDSADYGPAAWAPASTSNYTVANRETDYNINYIVIHVTQGSYAGSISWFQNPAAQVSAHYVVRSSDGAITQSVREKDIAWHAGNWTYNTQAIGIEHEGYIDDPSWFTDAMYRSSAALTRSLTTKYAIPRDRSHIIGHIEVPSATHTDPGQYWNWTYYMQLVNGVTGIGTGTVNVSGSLNIRSGPGTGYAVAGSLANGAGVSVYCQATGTTVTGTYGTSNIWDRIGTNKYVADAYVLTGSDGFIPGVPRC